MQKHLRKNKLLLIKLLAISAIISGCTSVPKPPTLEVYLHDAPSKVALCASSDGGKCVPVPIEKTDNWFMMKPRDWRKMQDYIDLLVCKVRGGCLAYAGTLSNSMPSNEEIDKGLGKVRQRMKLMEFELIKRKSYQKKGE